MFSSTIALSALIFFLSSRSSQVACIDDILGGLGGGFDIGQIFNIGGGGIIPLETICRNMAKTGKTNSGNSNSPNANTNAAESIVSALTGGRKKRGALNFMELIGGLQNGNAGQTDSDTKLIDNDCLKSNSESGGLADTVNKCVNFWVDEKIEQCQKEKVFNAGFIGAVLRGNAAALDGAILDLCGAMVKKSRCNKLKKSRDDEKCVFCDVVKLATVDDKKLQDCVCGGGLGAVTGRKVNTRLEDCIGGEVAKGVINTKVTGLVGC